MHKNLNMDFEPYKMHPTKMYHAYLIRILMGYIRYTLLWLYKNVGMGQTSVSLFNLILTVNILTVHHNFCKLTLPGIHSSWSLSKRSINLYFI